MMPATITAAYMDIGSLAIHSIVTHATHVHTYMSHGTQDVWVTHVCAGEPLFGRTHTTPYCPRLVQLFITLMLYPDTRPSIDTLLGHAWFQDAPPRVPTIVTQPNMTTTSSVLFDFNQESGSFLPQPDRNAFPVPDDHDVSNDNATNDPALGTLQQVQVVTSQVHQPFSLPVDVYASPEVPEGPEVVTSRSSRSSFCCRKRRKVTPDRSDDEPFSNNELHPTPRDFSPTHFPINHSSHMQVQPRDRSLSHRTPFISPSKDLGPANFDAAFSKATGIRVSGSAHDIGELTRSEYMRQKYPLFPELKRAASV